MNDRMRKTERLWSIWLLLSKYPPGYTAKELADRFQVNERTIYRDMLSLGSDLYVPVYNESGRWKLNESRFLPPIRFTVSEAINIFLAARLMLRYSQRYDPNIDATFTKISSVLPQSLSEQIDKSMVWMQTLPRDEWHLRIMATVAEAWISRKKLKINYHSLSSDKPIERVVDPYYIEPAAPGHASYILGFCNLKSQIRLFKVERIVSAQIIDESYEIPESFDANQFFAPAWGIVVDEDIKTVKLKIRDKDIIRLMEETIWHPSQKIQKQKDGSAIMTLEISDTVELLSWILGWGNKMEVLEPKTLRDEVIEAAEEILSRYRRGHLVEWCK